MPWGAAQRVLVKSPTIIAHIAKTIPAVSPGRIQRVAAFARPSLRN